MSDDSFQWPQDLFNLLVDAVPLLCRGKKDVILFFRGAGVSEEDLAPWRQKLAVDPQSVGKYPMTRAILTLLNERGDAGLANRRGVLHRVVSFEDFSTCWENDRLKAQGAVAKIRSAIDARDSLTRIIAERNADRQEARQQRINWQKEADRVRETRARLRRDLVNLRFADNAQQRGRALEVVLNEIFTLDGLLVRESFARYDEEGVVMEQIDGIIALDGQHYLVEMKWWSEPLGINPISRHLVRVFGRAVSRAILISASGYTRAAITACREVLSNKLVLMVDLQEIQLTLEREGNLAEWLRTKVDAVIANQEPYQPPITR